MAESENSIAANADVSGDSAVSKSTMTIPMDQELVKAIRCRDLRKLKEFQSKKRDFKGTSPKLGNTVLHIAARYGNFPVVDYIKNLDTSLLRQPNLKGETPLHIATKAGNFAALVSLFLEEEKTEKQKLLLKEKDNEGNTPLHNVVRNGDRFIADLMFEMIDKEDLPEFDANENQPPLLSIAIDARLTSIVSFIISENDSSLDHKGPDKSTPLHSAVIRQDYEIMDMILKKRNELVVMVDKHNRNPLHYAAASGHVKMARRLTDVNQTLVFQPDNNMQTPLHLAAKNGRINVLKPLLKHYPDAIEVLDNKNQNILHVAAEHGYVDIVLFILNNLPEMEDLINSPDEDGNTPLHLAARNFQSDVVYIFSRNVKVNIRATNRKKKTALQIVENSKSKGRDIQKHLTTKALKAAYADQALDPEDILEHRRFIQTEDIDDGGKGKEMAQTLSVMNTLIATFTFTAAFTIPGGFRSDGPDEGMAILVKRPSFQAFVITDTIAMTSSMTAAVIVFWSFWRSRSESFMDKLPLAIGLTWIGLISMTLAFVTGLFVVLSNNMALAITVCSIGCTLPLIFYIFAPFISLVFGQTEVNPLAFCFRMVKIFLKRPFKWCVGRSMQKANYRAAASWYQSGATDYRFLTIICYVIIPFVLICYGIILLVKAPFKWCFCPKSKRNEQLPK